MKFKKIIIYMLFHIIFCCTSNAFASDKKLVILASDNIETISLEAISNLYTLRQKLMPNSQRAQLTSQPINSEDTIGFTQKFFNYYPYQLKRIWDQAIFSGKARRPKQFDNADDLLAFIKSHDNAIGYLMIKASEISQVKETYNVIAIIG
jgi:hypothetical protein